MGVSYYTEQEISEKHEEIHSALQHPNWFSRSGLLKRVLSDLPRESSVLDLGSGAGETAHQLHEAGFFNITCVDIDNYLDTKQIGMEPKFVKANLSTEAFPIPDASQEIVLAIQVLEHLENPWQCAREILRVTKPGGRIIVAIPHAMSLINRWNFFWTGNIDSYTAKNNHIALFSNALLALLWKGQVRIRATHSAEGFVRIPFLNRKLRFRPDSWLGRKFTRKIAYVLQRV